MVITFISFWHNKEMCFEMWKLSFKTPNTELCCSNCPFSFKGSYICCHQIASSVIWLIFIKSRFVYLMTFTLWSPKTWPAGRTAGFFYTLRCTEFKNPIKSWDSLNSKKKKKKGSQTTQEAFLSMTLNSKSDSQLKLHTRHKHTFIHKTQPPADRSHIH